MMTDRQLKARGRKVQEAEAKLYQAQTFRDAAIAQAVAEGRTQTEVAALVGLTKARIGKIIAEVNEEP
jgi:hypothetical protein